MYGLSALVQTLSRPRQLEPAFLLPDTSVDAGG